MSSHSFAEYRRSNQFNIDKNQQAQNTMSPSEYFGTNQFGDNTVKVADTNNNKKKNRFAGMFSQGGFLDNSLNFLGKSYFNNAQSDQDKMIGLNEKYIDAMKGQPQFSDQRFAGQFLQADDGNFNVKFGTPASVAMFKEGATTGKSIGDRLKGGAGGLISGLSTGIPHMGGVGLVAGLL